MFPKKADLNSIRTLCLANSLEAAGGKAFVLKEARPGEDFASLTTEIPAISYSFAQRI